MHTIILGGRPFLRLLILSISIVWEDPRGPYTQGSPSPTPLSVNPMPLAAISPQAAAQSAPPPSYTQSTTQPYNAYPAYSNSASQPYGNSPQQAYQYPPSTQYPSTSYSSAPGQQQQQPQVVYVQQPQQGLSSLLGGAGGNMGAGLLGGAGGLLGGVLLGEVWSCLLCNVAEI